MKVLIIEDEAPAFRRLQKLLEDINPSLEIMEVLDSVSDSVLWLKHHQAPDLIFMDIQLSDGISFEIFEQIEIKSPVIFTTAYDEYTLRAFKVNSVDYLLKPINQEELKHSLAKYNNLKSLFSTGTPQSLENLLRSISIGEQAYKKRFLVKRGDRLLSVEDHQVAYFFTHDGLVFLRTTDGKKYLIDHTLDDLEQQLEPKSFFRLNRQYITSYEAIATTHKHFNGKLMVELQPNAEEQIMVSREKASVFKQWLDS